MRTMFAFFVFCVFCYVDEHSKDPIDKESGVGHFVAGLFFYGGILCLAQDIIALIKDMKG